MTSQSVIYLVLLIAMFLSSCKGEEKRSRAKERVFEVKTIRAEMKDYYLKYRTSGYFEAVHSVSVKPEVSGKVKLTYVEEGERVRKGDILLKIDDAVYRKAYEETLWNLRQAERDYENVKAIYERRRKLFEKELISKEEYEEAKTRLEVLEARIESLKAILEKKGLELKKAEVKAPTDGYILRRLVNIGDYVTPQRTVYEIVRLKPLRFVFKVPQEVAGSLKVNSYITIISGGEKIKTRVIYISPSADSSRMFTVKALIENRDGRFRPNMYGEVSFDFKKVRAIAVPEQAVQLSQRQSFVWTVRDSRAVKVPVDVLAYEEGITLIRGDIKEGERIITEGLMFLYEGAKVIER